jgi:hypothetical protein
VGPFDPARLRSPFRAVGPPEGAHADGVSEWSDTHVRGSPDGGGSGGRPPFGTGVPGSALPCRRRRLVLDVAHDDLGDCPRYHSVVPARRCATQASGKFELARAPPSPRLECSSFASPGRESTARAKGPARLSLHRVQQQTPLPRIESAATAAMQNRGFGRWQESEPFERLCADRL